MSVDGLENFPNLIIDEKDEPTLPKEAVRVDADQIMNLRETEVLALLDYKRVVVHAGGTDGRTKKTVIQMLPDDPAADAERVEVEIDGE